MGSTPADRLVDDTKVLIRCQHTSERQETVKSGRKTLTGPADGPINGNSDSELTSVEFCTRGGSDFTYSSGKRMQIEKRPRTLQ